MTASATCSGERHDRCAGDGCACGCHWLMPLVRGEVDQVVSPSGRIWARHTGGVDRNPG
jgi:hypothetical protein